MKAISYPFTLDPFGVVEITQDQTKIYQDRILTLLSTSVGERPMRPTYGTNVAKAMFENQTDAKTAIDAAIRSAIGTWIPEVDVEAINISSFDPNGAVGVEVNVSLPDFTSTSINVLSTTLNPDATTTR
jgi:phage baseplate assembly protein W